MTPATSDWKRMRVNMTLDLGTTPTS
jgi:hypothetical protein